VLVVSKREQRKSVNHCFAVTSPDLTFAAYSGSAGCRYAANAPNGSVCRF